MMNGALSAERKDFYRRNGYLIALPSIYSLDEMWLLSSELPSLLALLRPGETAKDIREWYETSDYL